MKGQVSCMAHSLMHSSVVAKRSNVPHRRIVCTFAECLPSVWCLSQRL